MQKFTDPIAWRCWIRIAASSSIKETNQYAAPIERAIRVATEGMANVRIRDPKAFMCGTDRCPVVIDGTVAFTDQSHISRTFARENYKRFVEDMHWLVEGDPDRGRPTSTVKKSP